MSVKIESYGSIFVGAAIVWYLAKRTNLAGRLASDVRNIPQYFTGFFTGSQSAARTQYYSAPLPREAFRR